LRRIGKEFLNVSKGDIGVDMRDTPLRSALGIMATGKVKGFGPAAHGKIVAHFSTFGELLDANEASLICCTNITQRNAIMQNGKELLTSAVAEAEAEIARSAEYGANPLTIYDAAYPERLRSQPNHPSLLFCAGDPVRLEKTVAVIGTRNVTNFNAVVTERLVAAFAEQGWGVVTGMEPGLQSRAHLEALKHGVVNGVVLGSGIDRYPYAAEELLIRIGDSGGVVLTEHPAGRQSDLGSQTRRYRLATALSVATLMLPCEQDNIETHAVKYAMLQDKPVIAPAIPEKFKDEPSNKTLMNLTRLTPSQYATLCGWKEEYMEAAAACERPTAAEPISGREDYDFLFAKLEMAMTGKMPVQTLAMDIAATFP
jgi:DNA processing protein